LTEEKGVRSKEKEFLFLLLSPVFFLLQTNASGQKGKEMFIKLTEPNGTPFLVNPSQICSVHHFGERISDAGTVLAKPYTAVLMTDKNTWNVIETLEEIETLTPKGT
jgi:hypothetical protein